MFELIAQSRNHDVSTNHNGFLASANPINHSLPSLNFSSQNDISSNKLKEKSIKKQKNDPQPKELSQGRCKEIETNTWRDKQFDPSLENIRRFFREFSSLVTQTVYDQYLDQPVKFIQDSLDHFSEYLKVGADWIIDIGHTTAKPLFEKLKKYDCSQNIETGLKHALAQLIKDSDEESLKEKLKNNLSLLPEFSTEDSETIDQVIGGVCYWIFRTDQSFALVDLFRRNRDPRLIQGVFNKIIFLLVENKIDKLHHCFLENFKDKLPQIIALMMQKNGRIITDYLSNRFCELVNNLGDQKYQQTFDSLVHTLHDYSQRLVEADVSTKEFIEQHQQMILEANELIKLTPRNPEELNIKDQCQRYLREIEQLGGLEGLERQHYVDVLTQRSGVKYDPNRNPYSELAVKIIEMILPQNGTFDAFADLISQLELPEEIVQIWGDFKTFVKEYFPCDSDDDFSEIGHSFKSFISGLAIEGGRKLLKYGIETGVQTLVTDLSNPTQLNSLMAEQIFPAIHESLTISFSKLILQKNLHQFVPQLTAIANQHVVIIEDFEEIKKQLFGLLSKEYAIEESESHSEFNQWINPLFQEISDFLSKIKQDPERSENQLSEDEVKIFLQNYLNEATPEIDYEEINPLYSEIINHYMFKLGNFGKWTESLFNFGPVRRAINKAISKSLVQMRHSHSWLINSIANESRKFFLDEKKVKDLLTFSSLENDQEKISTPKDHLQEIKKIAQISHAMAFFQAGQSFPFGKFFARKILGNDATSLDQMLQTVYDRILGNPAQTEQMIFNLFHQVVNALDSTSTLKPMALNPHMALPFIPINYSSKILNVVQPSIIQRILNVVKAFFTFFGLFRRVRLKLNQKQFALISSLRKTAFINKSQIYSSDYKRYSQSYLLKSSLNSSFTTEELSERQILDDSLEKLCSFTHNTMKLIIDELLLQNRETHIRNLVFYAKKTRKILKKASDWLIQIGDPVYHTLLRKIKEINYNMPPSEAFNEIVKELKHDNSGTLLEDLFAELEKAIKKENLPKNQRAEEYLHPIIEWLKDHQLSAPIDKFPKKKKFDEKIIQNLSKAALTFLVQRKIDQLSKSAILKIESDLPEFVCQFIQDNVLTIVDLLSQNFAERLQNLQGEEYTKFFDGLAKILNDQLTAFLEADTIVSKVKCEKEEVSEEVIHRRLLAIMMNRNDQIIHPVIHEKFNCKEEKQNSLIEEQFYQQLSEQLLSLFLPPNEKGSIDGLTALWKQLPVHKEIKHLLKRTKNYFKKHISESLLENSEKVLESILSFAQKFLIHSTKALLIKQLGKFIKEWIENFSKSDTMNDFLAQNLFPAIVEVNIQELLFSLIQYDPPYLKKIFNELLKCQNDEEMKDRVAPQLYNLLQKAKEDSSKLPQNYGQFYWDRMQIDQEMFNQVLFPRIILQINQFVTHEMLLSNLDEHVKLFLDWIDQDDQENVKKEIYDSLFLSLTKHHDLETSGLQDQLKSIFNPHVIHLKKMIEAERIFHHQNGMTFDEEKAKILIQNYLNPPVEDIPIYSNLILNILKIGKFGNGWIIGFLDFFKKSLIANKVMPALYRFRTSHRDLILEILNPLEKKFNEESIKEMLRGEKEPVEQQSSDRIQNILQEQYELVARIVYDFMFFNLHGKRGKSNWKWGTAAGADYTHLETVLKNFKEKFFDHPLLNKNLAFNLLEKMVLAGQS